MIPLLCLQGVGLCHAAAAGEEDFGRPPKSRGTAGNDPALAATSEQWWRSGAENRPGLQLAGPGETALQQALEVPAHQAGSTSNLLG